MSCTMVLGACILAAQLTHGGLGSSQPLLKEAKSYDGITRDISKFYTPKSRTFSIGGDIYTKNTKISLHYDDGINTPKFKVDDTIAVQVTKHMPINENWSINLTAGYKKNGQSTDISCSDDYGKEYYCGNLTAWSDHTTDKIEDDWNAGFTINYKF